MEQNSISNSLLEQGRLVFDIEARALSSVKDKIGSSFLEAVSLISSCQGKLVLTGMGKSGHIARKIASTFCSTGTTAVFVHPAESSHGDLGIISKDDVVLALSYGGASSEFTHILLYLSRKNIPLIAITGHLNSPLAQSANILLDVGVPQEACPLGLAPTASSTASLAMGDALAMTVLKIKGFSLEDFAEYHPGGSIGFKLLTKVKDIMQKGDSLPIVSPQTPVKEVLSIMTHRDVRGVAGIVDDQGDLIGLITDGDIRRRLEKSNDPLVGIASDLMTRSPRTIDADELAERALFLMEQFRIQMLFVTDKLSSAPNKPIGLLHIQDLLKAKVR